MKKNHWGLAIGVFAVVLLIVIFAQMRGGGSLKGALPGGIAGSEIILESSPVTPFSQILHAGENDVDLFEFKVNVKGSENILLSKLYFSYSNAEGNITNFKLYDPVSGVQLSSTAIPYQGSIKFIGINKTFQRGTSMPLRIKGTVTGSGVLTPGAQVWLAPSYIDYNGISSGVKKTSSGPFALRSSAMTTHDVEPAVQNMLAGGMSAPSSFQVIARYSVKAAGARPLAIKSFMVTFTGDFKEFPATTGIWINGDNKLFSWFGKSGNTVEYVFSKPHEIPAGGSSTFEIRGDTSMVKAGVTSGTVTLGTKVDQGGLGWSYTSLTGKSSGNLTTFDGAPVVGASWTY